MTTRRNVLTAGVAAAGILFGGVAAAQKPRTKYSNGNALKYIKAFCESGQLL
jgi:hypothetical protein